VVARYSTVVLSVFQGTWTSGTTSNDLENERARPDPIESYHMLLSNLMRNCLCANSKPGYYLMGESRGRHVHRSARPHTSEIVKFTVPSKEYCVTRLGRHHNVPAWARFVVTGDLHARAAMSLRPKSEMHA
jgi:hypothetical protein